VSCIRHFFQIIVLNLLLYRRQWGILISVITILNLIIRQIRIQHNKSFANVVSKHLQHKTIAL
jgi:hypothetical protein